MSEQIEGRNAVLEAFRSGKCVDKLFETASYRIRGVNTVFRQA
jgi:23S rRNA (guanosine2251-2'-O)-methyltransferase